MTIKHFTAKDIETIKASAKKYYDNFELDEWDVSELDSFKRIDEGDIPPYVDYDDGEYLEAKKEKICDQLDMDGFSEILDLPLMIVGVANDLAQSDNVNDNLEYDEVNNLTIDYINSFKYI